MALTIEHIAHLAKVSRSTVSRVLNEHPSVRPAVRARVLEVIEAHGYVPRAAARSLASRRTRVVSVVILRNADWVFAGYFFPPVIQGIAESCATQGYLMTLSIAAGENAQRAYEAMVRGRHCDGVILPASDAEDTLLPHLLREKVPLVLIGRHPFIDDVAWVDAENRRGGQLATSHLIHLGHRRIATITGPLGTAAGLDRRDGYLQALQEAGLSIESDLIVEGDFSQQSGEQGMKRLLALPRPPTAVFVAADSMALGALQALREAGRRVPEDLALVGFDDSPLAALASPALTTVRQPIRGLGVAAANLLIDRLDGRASGIPHRLLPVNLVVRQSCGAESATGQKGGAKDSVGARSFSRVRSPGELGESV